MLRALFTAATGMQAQQVNIDTIANNIANVNTTGFKQGRAEFQDLLYQTIRPAGTASSTSTTFPVGLQLGLGTRPVATDRIYTQGDFKMTGNPYDLTIEGKGFFQVKLPSGETGYTRDGSFHMSADGTIVTSSGDPLEPQITIPTNADSVTIGKDGTVSASVAGVAQQVGSLQLANFANPAGLDAIGSNLFRVTTASGDAVTGAPGEDGIGNVNQGFLESSNVSVVEEMVNMIVGQRAYEVNSKVVKAADEMLQTMNNVVR